MMTKDVASGKQQAENNAISERNACTHVPVQATVLAKCVAFLPQLAVVYLERGVVQTALLTGFLDLTKWSADHSREQ